MNLHEIRKSSYFSQKKNSVRGFKNDTLTLMRGPNGGFKNMKAVADRTTQLEDLLKQFDNIKKNRDQYDQEIREN